MVDSKQVIIVRKDLKLGKGKMAAQAAHASVAALENASSELKELWLETGAKKIVVWAEHEKHLLEVFKKTPGKIPKAMIKDAGFTQLKPGTLTCIALGPWDSNELDKYTRDLKLA